MSGPFKMNGSGKVYYEGSGDPINLNPKDLSEEYFDEYGNRAYDHKKTGDVFYKNKPRGESEIKEGEGPNMPSDRPIEGERFYT